MSLGVLAQSGTIRGTIIDETGEPLFSANAVIQGSTNGTTSDFDGKFELKVAPGTYVVEFSFIGYQQIRTTGVVVKAGQVTAMGTVKLEPATSELAVVTVTAEAVKSNETALLTLKKKSVNVMDGISSQTFKKIGDGNAAAAVTRVPGVSLQGGKYVFVRGLGDRYTKTQLNGMDVPGLDPDRNALQMDIFPTNIIDNIIVLKSFTADLPADFTGGLVNIETKEFPETPELSVSAGLGYTVGQSFNANYRTTEQGGSLDFLGIDDGFRDEPLGMSPENPQLTGNFAVGTASNAAQTRQFIDELAAKKATSPMNGSLSLAGGNQIKKDRYTLGFSGALNYKNNTDFYEEYIQNNYRKESSDPSVYELRTERTRKGPLGTNNVFLSGMGGFAIKQSRNKYKVNLTHLQNAERTAGLFFQEDLIASNNESKFDVITYTERSLTNLLLSGNHVLDAGDDKGIGAKDLEWKLSPTYSRINDKDFRTTPYLMDVNGNDTSYSINPNEVAYPNRFWRNLSEYNIPARIDLTTDQMVMGMKTKVKTGVSATLKYRSYEIFGYELLFNGNPGFTGNPDELLEDDFIYDPATREGTFIFGNYQRNNTYNGTQSTIAAYGSGEFEIGTRWKSIIGLRIEKYDQFYTGQNQIANNTPDDANARIFDNDNVLNLLDLFPTFSLIYQTDENSNLRFGYFRTTARPSFKEKSTAEIVDPISGFTFIGNIDLVSTYINNFDLRYEYFFSRNQTVAISGFYKMFSDPIELSSYRQDNESFQPRNVGDGQVLGIEFEGRLNMAFISEALEVLSLNTNISLIDARVKWDRSVNGTYEARLQGLREGEELGDYRDMQGQAPYIVNAGLAYTGKENGIETGVYYNVQGPKLTILGIGLNPDVYSVPFHSINYNFLMKFGEEKQYQVGLSVDNILNDKRETVTRSFGAQDQIFNRYNPGTSVGMSLSYKF
jgi:TonB-dependent receptor